MSDTINASRTTTINRTLSDATEQGRMVALATAGQRDLRRCAEAYPELFPARPFDPALFSTLTLATAVFAPEHTAQDLRIANRVGLWVFALDWQIDYLAQAAETVDGIVAACLSVADGGTPDPGDQLALFLAEVRDDLAGTPFFPTARELWRTELRRMLTAMAREWRWAAARARDDHDALPTFEAYLDNADSVGATFVNVSHWISTCPTLPVDGLAGLIAASHAVQRVLRLVNDLATYEREVRWGDLNALLLMDDRDEVTRRVTVLVDGCRQQLHRLEHDFPQEVAYLSRQIGFSSGFYQTGDFWGSL